MSGNCDDICYTRTEAKVHVLTCHEGDYDSKVKKKGKTKEQDKHEENR